MDASDHNSEGASHGELKKACSDAELERQPSGSTLNHQPAIEEHSARSKKFQQSVFQEFQCPISHELPVDPVMAEDGKVYERKAIEEWLDKSNKSPLTKKLISKKGLVSSTCIKNIIENVVESFNDGTEEDRQLVANYWESRREDESKKQEQLIKKADAGHLGSILDLGNSYNQGLNGFEKDEAEGFYWHKRAADLGNYKGMGLAGIYLLGMGIEKNPEQFEICQGIALLSQAAHRYGSDFACIVLGRIYAKGRYGFQKDKAQAMRLLKLGISGECSVRHTHVISIEMAKKLLTELEGEEEEESTAARATGTAEATP